MRGVRRVEREGLGRPDPCDRPVADGCCAQRTTTAEWIRLRGVFHHVWASPGRGQGSYRPFLQATARYAPPVPDGAGYLEVGEDARSRPR